MSAWRWFVLGMAAMALPAGGLRAAQQCLVVGDSLSKEYEVEFPALFPDNPDAWDSRNWIEILHQRRNAWFDLGNFSTYADPRITGHEHNWAFPGAQTGEIRSRLSSTNPLDYFWQQEFKGQVQSAVERVVVFAGGNDVDSYYGNIYNGSSPSSYINTTYNNLVWIVDHIRGLKSSLPMVLVAVPHVGCAPDVQAQFPTSSLKTGRVTSALDTLNANLAAFAQSRGIGFASAVYDMTRDMIASPFCIGGVEFYRVADADARTRYVWSGDGFHPNTCAHARIAQIIVNAFRAKYPSPNITPLPDTELLEGVLGLDRHLPLTEWLAGLGVPLGLRGGLDDPDGDGLENLLEFALAGLSAAASDASLLPGAAHSAGSLTMTYTPRAVACAYCQIVPQESDDLVSWTDVAAGAITDNGNGSFTVSAGPGTGGRKFLRLEVRGP